MVIETSALVAILLREAGWEDFLRAILRSRTRRISAISLLEASMVLENRKSYRGMAPNKFVTRVEAEIVPFDQIQLDLAIDAFRRYGKGRHRAALNLGDCCSYALSRALDQPLLFKGDDFGLTDVTSALKP